MTILEYQFAAFAVLAVVKVALVLRASRGGRTILTLKGIR